MLVKPISKTCEIDLELNFSTQIRGFKRQIIYLFLDPQDSLRFFFFNFILFLNFTILY